MRTTPARARRAGDRRRRAQVLTVGYGDMYPTSIAGKLTAAVLMVLSLIVLALPITIIGTTFNKAWEESKKGSMKMDAANASQQTHTKFIHKELVKLKERRYGRTFLVIYGPP